MNPSYAYVYDDFLSDKKFERDLASLETTLNTFDLAGRVGRLALFRSAKDLVEGMVRQGASTIVIVGNDATLDKTMWFLPDLDVTVGYIPLVGPSPVADLLGIPVGITAVDVLAARRVEVLDMGKLDDRYFFMEVSLPATMASLDIEGQYRVSLRNGGSLTIRNVGGRMGSAFTQADAQDGWLEAVLVPSEADKKSSRWAKQAAQSATHILLRRGEIVSKDPIEAHVDNHGVSGFRFQVSIVPKKLRLITGRGRLAETVLPAGARNGTFRPATEPRRSIGTRVRK